MKRALLPVALASAMVLFGAPGASAGTQFLSLYRTGVPTDGIGAAGLVASVDFTGDGVADIVGCSAGSPVVLSKSGTTFTPVWYGSSVGCTAVTVGDTNGDGKPEVVVGTNTGSSRAEVHVFDPTGPRKPVATVMVPSVASSQNIVAIAMGDVDSDGHMEIVAVTSGYALVYAASTLVLEWQATGHGGTDVHIGNVDDDGRTEIVINGSTGRVLDAYAQILKWGYAGGFGYAMTLGNVDTDPESEIVMGGTSSITILNGDDFTSSSFPVDGATQDILVADVNGTGGPEIVQGRSWSPTLKAYTASGTQLWTMPSPDSGAWGLAAGDVDGDGVTEVCFGSGLNSSGRDMLHVGSSAGTVKYTVGDLDGPYSTAVADLNGDGKLELVVATYSTGSGYERGLVQVLDYQTKAVKGTLTPPGTSTWYPQIWRLEVGQLDSDAALEVLVLGGDPYDGKLYAYDGVTYAHQWSGTASSSYSPDYIDAVAVANIDGDPISEIIIGVSDGTVQVLNGASPIIQYVSSALSGTIMDLAVADVNGDGSKDIVVGAGNAVHVLTPATGAASRIALSNSAIRVAATNGRLAVLDGYNYGSSYALRVYQGSDLSAQAWTCPYSLSSGVRPALAFGTIGGEERLLVGMGGVISILPLGGSSCPTAEVITHGRESIARFGFTDVTGDAIPELLLNLSTSYEILALGSTTEARGDVNRDGVVADTDIDALARYLLADGPGIAPSADVNGDGRVDLADVIYLINYRRGTGPAPVP